MDMSSYVELPEDTVARAPITAELADRIIERLEPHIPARATAGAQDYKVILTVVHKEDAFVLLEASVAAVSTTEAPVTALPPTSLGTSRYDLS